MADELLDELTTYCLCSNVDYGWYYSVGGKGCPLCQAAAEIKHLRTALALAVGELSTHHEHRHSSPEMLMQQFLQEARRG